MKMRRNEFFESSLEKLARVMTSKRGVNVYIQGNGAYTDGKNIFLPVLDDVDFERRYDLLSFLDHEVAHIKYTDFASMPKCERRFHREFLNAIEDSRIERLLPKEYPGTSLTLARLNKKWGDNMERQRPRLPWPIRFIMAMREYYDSRPIVLDSQIAPLVRAVEHLMPKLKTVRTTEDIRLVTKEIMDALNLAREQLADGSLEYTKEELEAMMKSLGAGQIPIPLDKKRKETMQATGEQSLDPAAIESKEDGEGEDEDGGGGSGIGKGKGEFSGVGANGGGGDSTPGEGEEFTTSFGGDKKVLGNREWFESEIEKQMMQDGLTGSSEFDKHVFSSESYIDREVEKATGVPAEIAKDTGFTGQAASERYSGHYAGLKDKIKKNNSVPLTTRFDKTENFSGTGEHTTFTAIRSQIKHLVTPMRVRLERVLKVKENARYKFELERGRLNTRSLHRLITEENYRTPFKEFSRVETKNIAGQLVIDCSGSMGGDKIQMARKTAIAFAETLQSLHINFEVVGFSTTHSAELSAYAATVPDTSRFNRTDEALHHMVYKTFEDPSLRGLVNIASRRNNADGESLIWAGQRLARRKEKRKIMIVLSDGQPSHSCKNSAVLAGHLKSVIEALPFSGIEVFGIGILTSDPKEFYPNYAIVDRLEDLPGTVVNQLSKMILDNYKMMGGK